MAINTNPIFTGSINVGFSRQTGTSAYTGYDLSASGSANSLIFTADATYGSFVQKIRWRALGTNSTTACRVYLNNGGSTTVTANNVLIDEIALSATTGSLSAATALFELPLNIAIAAGYKLYVTYGIANATTGWDVTVFAGDYKIPA
jgi:hypothetical protein